MWEDSKIMIVGLQTEPRMVPYESYTPADRHNILEFTFVHVPVGNYIVTDVYKYYFIHG